jgi:hypothetical protein
VNQSFSEHLDPFNGSLGLHYTDIRIPGTVVSTLRSPALTTAPESVKTNPNSYFGNAGVGWTVHLSASSISHSIRRLAGGPLFRTP